MADEWDERKRQVNELHLFAGAGGGCLASKHLLGHRIVGYVEKDSYCQKVLRARIRDGLLDDAPIFDDVRTFDGRPYRGRVDCVAGGFPCQPFSCIGNRKGEEDERNLWPDTIRIIREVSPRICCLENSPAITTDSYFGAILSDLAAAGYDARWQMLSAGELGAVHLRARIWLVAHSNSEQRGKQRRVANGPKWKAWDQLGWSAWWTSEPRIRRVDDRCPAGMDRRRVLGNMQCPIVAATAFRELMK
jgi:DNA (cytosine-5)-methyltransferase 1